jgi:hypothetical protein
LEHWWEAPAGQRTLLIATHARPASSQYRLKYCVDKELVEGGIGPEKGCFGMVKTKSLFLREVGDLSYISSGFAIVALHCSWSLISFTCLMMHSMHVVFMARILVS